MPKLSRDVVVLGWVSFFNDVSSEMVYPLLPLFVVATLDASATSLGWVEGVALATVAVLTAWVGLRSDRFRRRVPYIRIGYLLPVAGKALLATAVAWPMVLAGRTIDRIGKGIRSSPRDALIADVTEPSMLGRAFGLHRAMDSAGAVVGVLGSAALLYWLSGTPLEGGAPHAHASAATFRTIFAIAAALGLLAVGLTFVLRDPPHESASPPASARTALRELPRTYWIVVALMVLFSFANSSDTFILLRASDVGLAPWEVVLAYALFSFVYTVVSYPAGVLGDRFGRWRVIGAGWTLYALVYLGFAYSTSTTIWPLLAVYGCYIALTDGVGKALLVGSVPRERRGIALGLYYTATGATTLASNVVAGLAWDRAGTRAPFLIGAATAALAVVVMLVVRPWSRDAQT